eukprot:jgi/Chlat1/7288/Chrsp58S06918
MLMTRGFEASGCSSSGSGAKHGRLACKGVGEAADATAGSANHAGTRRRRRTSDVDGEAIRGAGGRAGGARAIRAEAGCDDDGASSSSSSRKSSSRPPSQDYQQRRGGERLEGSSSHGQEAGNGLGNNLQEVAAAIGAAAAAAEQDVTATAATSDALAAMPDERFEWPLAAQPHGVTVVVEERTFKILSMSSNIHELVWERPAPHGNPYAGLGQDARSLFTPAAAPHIQKAMAASDLSVFNPIAVFTASSGRPFFAILHRIPAGVVMDLEPISNNSQSLGPVQAGALASHSLAADAINRLQAIRSNTEGPICNAVVEEVRELTGYDRVMAYTFQKDGSGQVVAESVREDLEPYLGLNFPASDIPKEAKKLFLRNQSRLIPDCTAHNVPMLLAPDAPPGISLACSTLRGVMGCHRQYMHNMGTRASLVMAVIVHHPRMGRNTTIHSSKASKGRRVWGLIVCHHTTPRTVLYPLRAACQFLMQVFGLQLDAQLVRAVFEAEKALLRTQTILCDMSQREGLPASAITEAPSAAELIACDGAGLWHTGHFYGTGLVPTEEQAHLMVLWMRGAHGDSAGLRTDSLVDAGFPSGKELQEASIVGMAACRVGIDSYLMWFRRPVEQVRRWRGDLAAVAVHDELHTFQVEEEGRTYVWVRSGRSEAWADRELDAIHSLQLVLYEAAESDARGLRLRLKELSIMANEMVRLVETASAPIFAVDTAGKLTAWNAKVSRLAALPFQDAVGRHLVADIMADANSQARCERMVQLALRGEEVADEELQLRRFDSSGLGSDAHLVLKVNTCATRNSRGEVVGVCFVGQDMTQYRRVLDRYVCRQGDYTALVHNPSPLIPPLFGVDANACISEWNLNMASLSGWAKQEVEGRPCRSVFSHDVNALCRQPDPEVAVRFEVAVAKALHTGQDTAAMSFSFKPRGKDTLNVRLTVCARQDRGATCLLQHVSSELEELMEHQRAEEKACALLVREVAYLRDQVKPPIDGLLAACRSLPRVLVYDDQRQVAQVAESCAAQLSMITLDDANAGGVQPVIGIVAKPFDLQDLVNAVIAQAMVGASLRGLHISSSVTLAAKQIGLVLGDALRLQQVLADLARIAVEHTRAGYVEVGVDATPEGQAACVVLRVAYTGRPIARDLHNMLVDSNGMLDRRRSFSQVSLCQQLIVLMGGKVFYVSEPTAKGYSFNVQMTFPIAQL